MLPPKILVLIIGADGIARNKGAHGCLAKHHLWNGDQPFVSELISCRYDSDSFDPSSRRDISQRQLTGTLPVRPR